MKTIDVHTCKAEGCAVVVHSSEEFCELHNHFDGRAVSEETKLEVLKARLDAIKI